MGTDDLASLPSVEEVLQVMRQKATDLPHAVARAGARAAIADARAAILGGGEGGSLEHIAARALARSQDARRPTLRAVINATGVILQTNLGRAPLSQRALAAMRAVASGYSNLEYDLDEGERGSRHEHLRALLREVTGAEDGIVVNNNAAALFMVLQVFAAGREVLVSRGQAVEIGGGFRIPDVMRQSGAQLVEVGTTNRTYADDYRRDVGTGTAAILRVHSSNFRVVGFATEPSIGELATVAREHGIRLFDDLGSGCLIDTRQFGLAHEPTIQESIVAGADLALSSGDKLLGGPQAGIIVGRADLTAELRRHPLARALRVDKLTIAALEATLRSYAEGRAIEEIPLWRVVATPEATLKRRATRWARAAGGRGGLARTETMVGGGSLPGEGLPSWGAAFAIGSPGEVAGRLRECERPIIARISEGRVLLDPRTVDESDDRYVASEIERISQAIQR